MLKTLCSQFLAFVHVTFIYFSLRLFHLTSLTIAIKILILNLLVLDARPV